MQINRKPESSRARQEKARRDADSRKRALAEGRPALDLASVASATECTGIQPALPPDEYEEE